LTSIIEVCLTYIVQKVKVTQTKTNNILCFETRTPGENKEKKNSEKKRENLDRKNAKNASNQHVGPDLVKK
jgi:hypothetical protein